MSLEEYETHIDPHVHCRDWNEAHKATLKSVMDLARKQGVRAIFDMPNTSPPITSRELVEKRIETARREGCLEGYYLYIGLTSDPNQIREAVEVAEGNNRVVGVKMYAAKSVGELSVTDERAQSRVFKELADAHFDGVFAVHCEKEGLFRMDLWDPKKPQSWNLARPLESEVESVKDQIRFAKEARFKGTLHICHVSTPETVRVIRREKGVKITCGATPHHLTYSTLDMVGEDGLMYKVNPPLRDRQAMLLLRECLKDGEVDWIETDHAPHTRIEKTTPPFPSGIQSLKEYSSFLDSLTEDGVTREQIYELTCGNIERTFGKNV